MLIRLGNELIFWGGGGEGSVIGFGHVMDCLVFSLGSENIVVVR